jgi:hypothetical protein
MQGTFRYFLVTLVPYTPRCVGSLYGARLSYVRVASPEVLE